MATLIRTVNGKSTVYPLISGKLHMERKVLTFSDGTVRILPAVTVNIRPVAYKWKFNTRLAGSGDAQITA